MQHVSQGEVEAERGLAAVGGGIEAVIQVAVLDDVVLVPQLEADAEQHGRRSRVLNVVLEDNVRVLRGVSVDKYGLQRLAGWTRCRRARPALASPHGPSLGARRGRRRSLSSAWCPRQWRAAEMRLI